ncbi:MAG TPA: DUF1634 domain-containing protein [Candidatus Methanomethylicus sp.]|nr:DUF1634 domain-containing protein [Candidatus Methanomethylicus sp.]HRR54095.1 DUF1634 domain-containing protein [Candidatus Methanomethylicus sp.]
MVDVETTISWILRAGVLVSAALMAIGLFINPSIIWMGVLVLALTPFIRVLMAGLYFLGQKDAPYFVIALYVILVLVISSLMKM